MSTVKFGLACDGEGCTFREDDYHVDRIRTCEDCGKDLCPACALKTDHVAGKEADVDCAPTWRGAPVVGSVRCAWCRHPIAADGSILCHRCGDELAEELKTSKPEPKSDDADDHDLGGEA